MISLSHLSGSLQGTTTSFEARELIQIGRAEDCEVRFDPRTETRVSSHHAHIVLQQGAYWLVDTDSTNGTTVNGERVQKHLLKSGDRIVFGHPGGPEVEVTVESAAPRRRETSERIPTEFAPVDSTILKAYGADDEAAKLASVLKAGVRDSAAVEVAEVAAGRIAEERARIGKKRSGQSMEIMARAFDQVSHHVKDRTRRKWVRVVAWVAGVAAVAIVVLGAVVFLQRREIAGLLERKRQIDAEIQSVEQLMRDETDPAILAELEDLLAILSGSAERTVAALGAEDSAAASDATRGDQLEQDIRAILRKFNASTYAIPPIFKERLQYHIDRLVRAGPTLEVIYRRKQRHWPTITAAFTALGLPEEMAYVAWEESAFDPTAESPAGAKGMWQMTPSTARALGLIVEGRVDERTDVEKQTRAAARHLANLLAEFGEDSFMLAMASYNRGEAGVRRVLREVAREPGGFRKEKRDFWHLYRLKKLPEETREYVPKVLAAAIVAGNPGRYGLEP